MRVRDISSPRIFAIAFVGFLFTAAPAWAATWHRSQSIACCPPVMQNCSTVCSLKGKTPVLSVTNKNTYRVCRRSSSGETNRVGYQRSKGTFLNACRVDDRHPDNPVPYDCLCD